MAKFIAISCMGYEGIENMFDIGLNNFRQVPGIEIQRALSNKEIIWIRHVNDLTQALTLHSIGLTNKEIQLSLYFTSPPDSLVIPSVRCTPSGFVLPAT